MNTKQRDLVVLARLTGLVHDADQARMNALRRREAALRDTLAALDSDWRSRTRQAQVQDVALRSGADHLWQCWIDRRRIALNQELARVMVALSRARTILARSYGRDVATRDLLLQANRKLDRTRTLRAGPEA